MSQKFLHRPNAGLKSAVLLLATTAALPAWAQSQPVEEQRSETDIIVTAGKREELLSKIPAAVSAIGGDTLERMGADTFSDYAKNLAGVAFTDRGNGQTQIAIRGVASGADLDTGPESTVGVYIDEIPLTVAMAQADLKLFDIERVEVLRGPQGTLYGSGSMGGTLRIITPKPKLDTFEGKASGEFSVTEGLSTGYNYGLNGMINVPIVNDMIGARLTGYYRYNDGYVNDINLGIKNVNDEEAYGGRLAIRIVPSDPMTIDLNLIYQKAENGGLPGYDIALPRFQKRRKVREIYDDDLTVLNGTVKYDFGGAELTSSTSFFDRGRLYIRDASAQFGATSPNIYAPQFRYQTKNFVQETRLASTGDGTFGWVVGFFYNKRTEIYDADAVIITPTTTTVGINSYSDTKIRQFAGFGEASYKLTPDLKFTAGVRIADASSNMVRINRVSGILIDRTSTASPISPKFNLSWTASDDILAYAQVAKGFRIGGNNLLVPDRPGLPSATPTYGDDSLWSYEIGLKTKLLDRKLTLNLAAYRIDWNNIQLQYNRTDGFSWFVNASAAKIEGVELESIFTPNRQFTFQFNATYTNGRLSEPAPSIPAPEGQSLPVTPKWKLSGAVDYTFPLSNSTDGFVRLDAAYVGPNFSGLGVAPQRLPQGDYTIVNLRTGITTGKWGIDLFVKNLFNEFAVLFATQTITRRDEVNRPRTFGIAARTSF